MTDKQIIKHKVCEYQVYLDDGEGFMDGFFCHNTRQTRVIDCPYLPSETYKCKHYVEGDEYDYC